MPLMTPGTDRNRTDTFFHDVGSPLKRNHELLQQALTSISKKSFDKRVFGKIACASFNSSFGEMAFPGAYLGLR